MLSLPTQTTYNHMNIIRNRLDENSSTYKKWIKRRVQREKKLRIRKKQHNSPPPPYQPPNYYSLPHIPPPPYESYDDYCKRTQKNK